MVDSFHIPRALSDEALRLLTTLPMEEIERRLRVPMAADGEVTELTAWLTKEMPPGTYIGDPTWWASRIAGRAHILMKHQALRPIPVSERLPGPEDCAGAGDCWWYSSFMSAWIIGDVFRIPRHRFRHWLPAHALPLPEVE